MSNTRLDMASPEAMQRLIDIGIALSTERRLNTLLKRIVSEARSFANCDAGTLYIREGQTLRFVVSQCESLDANTTHTISRSLVTGVGIPLNDRSIAGFVAITGKSENIADAYDLPTERPYTHSKVFDEQNNYRTRSILAVPLKLGEGKVLGVLQLINHLEDDGHVSRFHEDVIQLVEALASQAAVAVRNVQMADELRNSHFDTILRLSAAAEFRDNETGNHVRRVSSYSELLARQIGLDDDHCEMIRQASPLHDIGKIGIPDGILRKPGRLTDEEMAIMRTHTEIGARIVGGSESSILKACEIVARCHHEKWDGSGYPRGLKGEDIPIEGRVVALADVFDALASKRVYKDAMPIEKVVAIIREESGRHFDPKLVDAFMVVLPDFREILEALKDETPEAIEEAGRT